MQKKITFVGQEHSPVLDKHINEQLEKIERFLEEERSPIFIEVIVEQHKTHQYNKISAHVKTPNYDCFAEHEGPDTYLEINETLDRMLKQLRTQKQKLVDRHKHGCDKECRSSFGKEENAEETFKAEETFDVEDGK
jgi:ribosomal subunit interface protein